MSHKTTHRSRKLILLGAGPLPSPGSPQAPGVANRLWHFLQPALAAGHDCLALTITEGVPRLAETPRRRPEMRHWRETSWQELAVSPQDCLAPEEGLGEYGFNFQPDVLIGAGTLLAGATACKLAGDALAWADLFGDPLAEIEAKAQAQGGRQTADETLQVWRLMMQALLRADAFSTVSRRQADALLGELLLTGRTASPMGTSLPEAAIHVIPCGLEQFDWLEDPAEAEWCEWKESHGLPGDARVAVWTGGFNAWSDPQTLVHGLELVMDMDPRLHLIATGGALEGYLGQVYEDFLAKTKSSRHARRMHALGWLPMHEAHAWLAGADFGLMVDRPCAETRLGARNRLLYLAAARCPIVASRGTEVVEEMERCGALVAFNGGNPESMARAIRELTMDEESCRWVGRRGYEYCKENFTFAATTKEFLDFAALAPELKNMRQQQAAAGRWIQQYLDVDGREREWRELNHYRQGRWARLKQLFSRRKK